MTQDPADLANLRDLALPPPVPWWPPTFGWWVLAAGLLAIVLLLVARLVRRYRANAYRRAAVREVRALTNAAPDGVAAALSAILKRTALISYPRVAVAALSREAWAGFLARTGGFPQKAAANLAQAAVDPAQRLSVEQANAARTAARRWIRRHRRETTPW